MDTRISRRDFLCQSAALSMLPAMGLQGQEAAGVDAVSRPPNIVYVFADQMRACARGGFPGGDPVLTPRLDQFAREGIELNQAASTFPLCSPHRAMLLSGRYPHRNTVMGNINSHPKRDFQLLDSQKCVTDVLAEGGYDVGYIGKWHLTRPHEPYLEEFRKKDGLVWNEFTPPQSRHGIGYWYGYNTYDQHLRPMYWDNDAARQDYHFVEEWGPDHETDKAIAYLRDHARSAKPFALFVSYNPPHPPFDQVPKKWTDLYRDASARELLTRDNVRMDESDPLRRARQSVQGHFGMISGVDAAFGRLLDSIDELGLRGETLVVFTSDHGEMMGSQQLMGKLVWYDESFRVPFLARWPGRLPENRRDDLLIDTPDIPATLVGLAGLGGRIPDQWQGRDYSALLRGESTGPARPEGQLYWMNYAGIRGIRTHRHTLVLTDRRDPKLNDRALHLPILHDNREDPWQLANVAQDRPAVVDELTSLLLDRCRSIEDAWEPLARA